MAALARRTVATVQGKFESKPMTYTADHKNLASYVGHGPPRRNAVVNRGPRPCGGSLALFLKLCMGHVGGRLNETLQTTSLRGAAGSLMILSVRSRVACLPRTGAFAKDNRSRRREVRASGPAPPLTLSQPLPPRGTTFAARGRLSSTLT